MSVGITSLSSVSAGVFSPEAPRPKRGVGLYGTGAERSPAKAKGKSPVQAIQGSSPQRQAVNAVFGASPSAAAGPEPGSVQAPAVPDVALGSYQALERVGVTGTLNFDRDAPAVVGVLAEGEKIVALEGAVSDAGVKRIRISSGWISLVDAEGTPLLEKLPDTVAAKKWRGGLAAMRQMARAEVEGADDSYKGQWRFNAKDLKDVLERKRDEAEQQRQQWEQKKAEHQEEVRAKLNKKPLSKKGKQYVSKYADRRQSLLAAKAEREQRGRVALQPSVYGQFNDVANAFSPQGHAAGGGVVSEASPHAASVPRGKDWYEHDPSMRMANEEVAMANSRPVAFLARTRGIGIGKDSHRILTNDAHTNRVSPQQQWRVGGSETGDDVGVLERDERKRLRKERRRARSTDMALQRQRDEITRGDGDNSNRAQSIAEHVGSSDRRQARGGILYPGQKRHVPAPVSLSPPPIPVHHTKNTGARAAAADIATAVRNNPTALSERFTDINSVLDSVSIPSELQAAAAAASIQNTSLGDPHDHQQQRRSGNGEDGSTPSVLLGMGAGADAAGQLGPGREVVSSWRVSDVAQWLRSTCGLAAHVPRFVEQGMVLSQSSGHFCNICSTLVVAQLPADIPEPQFVLEQGSTVLCSWSCTVSYLWTHPPRWTWCAGTSGSHS
eukprot:COSAG02_NODE_21_length_53083_cov_95.733618_35_plen_668_part_00